MILNEVHGAHHELVLRPLCFPQPPRVPPSAPRFRGRGRRTQRGHRRSGAAAGLVLQRGLRAWQLRGTWQPGGGRAAKRVVAWKMQVFYCRFNTSGT